MASLREWKRQAVGDDILIILGSEGAQFSWIYIMSKPGRSSWFASADKLLEGAMAFVIRN